jgi:acyl-CoA hydrolase
MNTGNINSKGIITYTAGVQRGQFDSDGLTLQSGVAAKEISNGVLTVLRFMRIKILLGR